MSDLTDFLLARIADDEAVALRHFREETESTTPIPGPWELEDQRLYETLVIPLGRVLAECEAKRRIADEVTRIESSWVDVGWSDWWSNADPVRRIVAYLATVYADHPDFREEWRL